MLGQGGEGEGGVRHGVVDREEGTSFGRCLLLLLVAEVPVQDQAGVYLVEHEVGDLLSCSGAVQGGEQRLVGADAQHRLQQGGPVR